MIINYRTFAIFLSIFCEKFSFLSFYCFITEKKYWNISASLWLREYQVYLLSQQWSDSPGWRSRPAFQEQIITKEISLQPDCWWPFSTAKYNGIPKPANTTYLHDGTLWHSQCKRKSRLYCELCNAKYWLCSAAGLCRTATGIYGWLCVWWLSHGWLWQAGLRQTKLSKRGCRKHGSRERYWPHAIAADYWCFAAGHSADCSGAVYSWKSEFG